MKRGRVKRFLVLAVITAACARIIFRHSPGVEIAGKVILKGSPPPEIAITLDSESAKLHPDGLTTRHYMVAPDGGLANVFVYIKKGLEGQSFPSAKGAAVVEFRRCRIEPYVLGVRTNQPVKFLNRDQILHNAHCTPGVRGNKEFSSALIPHRTSFRSAIAELLKGRWPWRTPTAESRFPSTEVLVRIKCDVHPWEFGYLGVVEHPAVTGSDGTFRFPSGLPPGKYVIEAKHLKAGAVTEEITFAHGETKSLTFTLEVPPRR